MLVPALSHSVMAGLVPTVLIRMGQPRFGKRDVRRNAGHEAKNENVGRRL